MLQMDMSVELKAKVVITALKGLREMHARGVYHGGITPDSLRIADDWSAVLVGFQHAHGLDSVDETRLSEGSDLEFTRNFALSGNQGGAQDDFVQLTESLLSVWVMKKASARAGLTENRIATENNLDGLTRAKPEELRRILDQYHQDGSRTPFEKVLLDLWAESRELKQGESVNLDKYRHRFDRVVAETFSIEDAAKLAMGKADQSPECPQEIHPGTKFPSIDGSVIEVEQEQLEYWVYRQYSGKIIIGDTKFPVEIYILGHPNMSFLRSAEALRRLDGTGVAPRVFDLAEEIPPQFKECAARILVLEDVEYQVPYSVVKNPEAISYELVAKAIEALKKMHSHNVYHGNIIGASIRFNKSKDRVQFVEFESARSNDPGQPFKDCKELAVAFRAFVRDPKLNLKLYEMIGACILRKFDYDTFIKDFSASR